MIRVISILFLFGVAGCSLNKARVDDPDRKEYYAHVRAFIGWFRKEKHLDSSAVIEDSISRQGFMDDMNECANDTVSFDSSECRQIRSWIGHERFAARTRDLTGPARFIRRDSLQLIFSDPKFRADRKSGGWDYIHQHYGSQINAFGCPLFLRNYTLCVFYSEYTCGGLCGEGSLDLYKKEGDHWVWVRGYGSWVS